MTKKQREPQKQFMRDEYVQRINRVMDYIEKNMDARLTLEGLAKVANFSSFHFHRIFGAMVGETLNRYIRRIRIEKSATLLIQHPQKTVTEVALDCGFSGSAPFARAFRETYGMSASQWRNKGFMEHCRVEEKRYCDNSGAVYDSVLLGFDPNIRAHRWQLSGPELSPVTVEVRAVPDLPVAYVRHIGPYQGQVEVFQRIFEALMKWAVPRGFTEHQEMQILAVYHDNPQLTDEEKLKVDACITVPKGTHIGGGVGYSVLSGGLYAIGHFKLRDDEYGAAWQAMVGGWLPESGYLPDDRLCFECYPGGEVEGSETHLVNIHIPVVPL